MGYSYQVTKVDSYYQLANQCICAYNYNHRQQQYKPGEKPMRYQTLNESLASVNLIDAWDITYPAIDYCETRRWTWQDGSKYGRLISVYRDQNGLYETPVHYAR